jgi:hypothetical protein
LSLLSIVCQPVEKQNDQMDTFSCIPTDSVTTSPDKIQSEVLKTAKLHKKTADSVWKSLYMRDNEKVQHHSRPRSSGLSCTQFQHLKVLESMIPKDQKNIITLGVNLLWLPLITWHLPLWCINIRRKRDPYKALKQQNYMKTADPVWLSLYMRKNEKVQHPICS